jgi:hypothetical protein
VGDFLTIDEFERYRDFEKERWKHHDDRQERFFVEHNGALNDIRRDQREIKLMLKEGIVDTKTLIRVETEAREGCSADCEGRLQALEEPVTEAKTRKKLIKNWQDGLILLLGLSLTLLSITAIIVSFVR